MFFRKEKLQEMQATLQRLNTPDIIVQTILQGFQDWLSLPALSS
jgi:hypothetical protein